MTNRPFAPLTEPVYAALRLVAGLLFLFIACCGAGRASLDSRRERPVES